MPINEQIPRGMLPNTVKQRVQKSLLKLRESQYKYLGSEHFTDKFMSKDRKSNSSASPVRSPKIYQPAETPIIQLNATRKPIEQKNYTNFI